LSFLSSINCLRYNTKSIADIGEDFKLISDPDIVPVAAETIADYAIAHLMGNKGAYEGVIPGAHFGYPSVIF
jgi:fructose-1,6-bisphosphatase/sedoheptulose 1,7-bisphosphatase-like protein